jgi:DNA (cytosine-5)-methyltransferase 1
LKAGDHGVPGGENMVVNQAGRVRYFTLREMARLQDLPDEFVVSGGWKAATRQLGNAVPASMAEFFGTFVRGLLPAQAGGSDQAAGPMPHEKQETVLAVP